MPKYIQIKDGRHQRACSHQIPPPHLLLLLTLWIMHPPYFPLSFSTLFLPYSPNLFLTFYFHQPPLRFQFTFLAVCVCVSQQELIVIALCVFGLPILPLKEKLLLAFNHWREQLGERRVIVFDIISAAPQEPLEPFIHWSGGVTLLQQWVLVRNTGNELMTNHKGHFSTKYRKKHYEYKHMVLGLV